MKIYLFIVGILSTFVLTQCDEPPTEMAMLFEECGKEHGFTEEIIEPPNFDDPKMKCLAACMLKKKDVLVDGKITADKLVQFADKILGKELKAQGEALLNECAGKANEAKGECDVGGAFAKCLIAKPKQ